MVVPARWQWQTCRTKVPSHSQLELEVDKFKFNLFSRSKFDYSLIGSNLNFLKDNGQSTVATFCLVTVTLPRILTVSMSFSLSGLDH